MRFELYCNLCQKNSTQPSPVARLCDPCWTYLDSYAVSPRLQVLELEYKSLEVLSLWHYQGVIRQLILDAKAGHNWAALMLLVCAAMAAIEESFWEGVAAVAPAPASTWSRLRGKTDIAFVMADVISRQKNIPLVDLAYKRSWLSSTKQAKKARHLRQTKARIKQSNELGDQGKAPSPTTITAETVLLVDDVITTGYTINSLVNGNSQLNVKAMTLSSALKR